MTRSQSKESLLHELGAQPVVADALDRSAVLDAVATAGPDVLIHQLTAIPAVLDPRHLDRDFAETDRLRTDGTDHLLEAARETRVGRFVAQSYTGWPYARTGDGLKSEDDPLDDDPPEALRRTLESIRHLERAVTGAAWTSGLVLRYGSFYGPGTAMSVDPPGAMVQAVRRRQLPLVGDGAGVWSFIHVDDAAAATAAAVERGRPGLYNVVDDDPSPVHEWLPTLASQLGAKPPMRLPRWVARLAAGEATVMMMTETRGVSNAKAKRELGWEPRHSSWTQGFVEEMRASERSTGAS
jgi:nucleoside-diphosphate-sugar epimerase